MKKFKPIRCHKEKETPYLRKFLPTLQVDKSKLVVDLGCGNLRNTYFAKNLGYKNILSFDRAGDFGQKLDLGCERIPVKAKQAGIILCNYLICFLNPSERLNLFSEIRRIAEKGCYLFVELYPAKCGVPYNVEDIRASFAGWKTINISKNRFILKKN